MMKAHVGSAALQTVRERVYQRGIQDGLAQRPAQLDPSLATSVPALLRAYSDGYQLGVRTRRARPRSLTGWLRHRS